MGNVLLINPNTSASVTELPARHATALAPDGATLHAATALFGAAYISSEDSAAVAADAVAAVWAEHVATHGRPDAVLVACFGDPGAAALCSHASVPVLGLA